MSTPKLKKNAGFVKKIKKSINQGDPLLYDHEPKSEGSLHNPVFFPMAIMIVNALPGR